MRQWRIVVVLFLISMAAVDAGAQEIRRIHASRDGAGHETEYRVPQSQLLATKRWSPEFAAAIHARRCCSCSQEPEFEGQGQTRSHPDRIDHDR